MSITSCSVAVPGTGRNQTRSGGILPSRLSRSATVRALAVELSTLVMCGLRVRVVWGHYTMRTPMPNNGGRAAGRLLCLRFRLSPFPAADSANQVTGQLIQEGIIQAIHNAAIHSVVEGRSVHQPVEDTPI